MTIALETVTLFCTINQILSEALKAIKQPRKAPFYPDLSRPEEEGCPVLLRNIELQISVFIKHLMEAFFLTSTPEKLEKLEESMASRNF